MPQQVINKVNEIGAAEGELSIKNINNVFYDLDFMHETYPEYLLDTDGDNENNSSWTLFEFDNNDGISSQDDASSLRVTSTNTPLLVNTVLNNTLLPDQRSDDEDNTSNDTSNINNKSNSILIKNDGINIANNNNGTLNNNNNIVDDNSIPHKNNDNIANNSEDNMIDNTLTDIMNNSTPAAMTNNSNNSNNIGKNATDDDLPDKNACIGDNTLELILDNGNNVIVSTNDNAIDAIDKLTDIADNERPYDGSKEVSHAEEPK